MAFHIEGNTVYDDEEYAEHIEWKLSLFPTLLLGAAGFLYLPTLTARFASAGVSTLLVLALCFSRRIRIVMSWTFLLLLFVAVIVWLFDGAR